MRTNVLYAVDNQLITRSGRDRSCKLGDHREVATRENVASDEIVRTGVSFISLQVSAFIKFATSICLHWSDLPSQAWLCIEKQRFHCLS